jgi:hypothetical protein
VIHHLLKHLNNCGNYRAIKEIPLPFSLSRPPSSVADEIPAETTQPMTRKITGNFYGLRDFENRLNVDKPKTAIPNRPSSVLDLFNRLKSSSEESDLDLEDEFSE